MKHDPMERLSRANPTPDEMPSLAFEPVRSRMHDEPQHPAAIRRSRRAHLVGRRGLAVGSAAVLAAVAVGVVVVTGALTDTSSAFAISRSGQSVKISLYRFEALGALNARLAAQDIPIRAVAVVPGCSATTREVDTGQTTQTPRTLQAGTSSGAARSITVVLRQRPGPGETVIIGLARSGRAQLFPHEITGPVPRCVAAPAHTGNGIYYPPAKPQVVKIFPAPLAPEAHDRQLHKARPDRPR